MPGPNPKKRQIKFSMFWMYAIILLFLAGIFYLDDNSIEKEVSYTEFENIVAPKTVRVPTCRASPSWS